MKWFFQYLSLPCSLLLLQACSNNSKPLTDVSERDTLLPPYVIPIDSLKPVVTLLDKAPKPKVIPFSLPGRVAPKGNLPNDQDSPSVEPAIRGISRFTNFTMADGLGLNTVMCATLDQYGNLWFGHDGAGVTRYDGKTFTTFTKAQGLASNYVFGITEDKSGNLFFLTPGSVNRFDGKRFTQFGKTNPVLASQNSFIQAIIQDSAGNIWFASGASVGRFDGKSFTFYTTANGLPGNEVTAIREDRSGKIWFGTYGGGISCFDGKKFNTFTKKTNGLADDYITCITLDRSGRLWFGTEARGVSCYDGNKFTTFTRAKGLVSDSILCITEDKNGDLWFGTKTGGASRFVGKSFTSFTTAEGLGSNAIYTITADSSGSIWFGTYGAGIYRYDGDAFTVFSTAQGLCYNSIMSIAEDRSGNMWFGSAGGGVSSYDGKRFTTISTKEGLAADYVRAIRTDRAGNLWFAQQDDDGLTKYDGKNLTPYSSKQGLAGVIESVMVDEDQNIWAGGFGRLSRFDGKTICTTFFNFPGVFVDEILQDQSGNIWFGSSGGGLFKYDGKSFTQYTMAQGLPDDDIRCIAEDKKGKLWIGTGLGVSRFDGKRFENLSTADGLDDNNVYDIIFDKEHNMYISTNIGIMVLPERFTSLPVSKMREGMKYFSVEQGYPISAVWRNSMYCDSKGIIWIGTANEKAPLIRFDPSALPKHDSLPPSLVIQQIKIDEQKICWSDLRPDTEARSPLEDETSIIMPANITEENLTFRRTFSEEERESMRKQFGDLRFDSITSFYLLPVNLRLPQTHNNISIDFNATEVTYPNLVNYQYLLEGYTKDWSPVTKSTTASFGNMHEGKYTFKVKAQGPNGVWSAPFTYAFRVLPPWWRTWWAYTFYGLCLLIGVFFTDRIRRRIVVEKEREKTRERELSQAKEIEKAYTELKSTQAQLIQSEKMASLGELSAGIAHEIQNPLNFVNNFSEVNNELLAEMKTELVNGNAQNAMALADDVIANEEKINQHGKRADAIVKGMLQHSQSNSGVKELADINAMADEYLRLAFHGFRAKDSSFNATMKTDFDGTIGSINIVPQDIGRVMLNIYNNAFYSVNEKAKEQIAGFEPTVSVSTKRIGNKIEIKVEDNGNGIPATIVDKIFQPFFTTKPTGQGTGLGLSLAFDVVKAHGGEIKVSSRPGEYSTFTLHLPY